LFTVTHKNKATKGVMAKPGIIYRLNWQAFSKEEPAVDIQCFIDISDNDNLIDDGDEAEVRPLVAGGVPAELSVIDNNDDVFTPVRAQQLTIQFVSDSNYSMSTFVSGTDQRWGVHYYIDDNTKTVFKGFIVMDDLTEPLLDPAETVVLTATDNLGSLSDMQPESPDNIVAAGRYRLIELISKCLLKTGLSLSIYVSMNVKLEGMEEDISVQNLVDEHFYRNAWIDALTFEQGTGELQSYREILEKILGFNAALFQYQGAWWILRLDEMESSVKGMYVTEFDENGEFVNNLGDKNYDKEIGIDVDIKFSEEATTVRAVRPYKSVRLDYNYDFYTDIPFNHDFRPGDLITTVSATKKRFVATGWRLIENLYSPIAPTGGIFTEIIYATNGQESERYLLLTSPVSPTANNLAISHPFYVHQKDRFDFSVDFATVTDINGSGSTYTQRVATIRLVADDGTFWMMDIDGTWAQSNSSWSVNFKDLEYQFVPNNIDTTEFANISVSSNDIPRSGKIYIDLYAMNQQGTAIDNVDIKFNNLQLTYKPFINGSYTSYSGQYYKTSQSGNYKASIKDTVSISSSPKQLIRGSLFKVDTWQTVFSGAVTFDNDDFFTISGIYYIHFYQGQVIRVSGTSNNNFTTRVTLVEYGPGTGLTIVRVEANTVSEVDGSTLIEEPVFSLIDSVYDAYKNPGGVGSDPDLLRTFGELQIFDVWNQYKNEGRILQATVQGLDLDELDGSSLPDTAHMINEWYCSDPSLHLINKRFILLSFSQNHDTQGWTGVLRQVINLTKDKDYSSYEFKFIENG